MAKSRCQECGQYFYGQKCKCGFQFKNQNESLLPFKPRCYVVGCNRNADERRGENIWMCRHHSDEYILKIFPNSIESAIILTSRRLEKEAKDSGMTNREYFEATNKSAYERSQTIMKQKSNNAKSVVEAQKVF